MAISGGTLSPRIEPRSGIPLQAVKIASPVVVSGGTDSGDVTDQLPLANLITFGARDFALLRDFYQRVGWPQVMDDGEYAVFELRGILLAIFPLASLARDGNTTPEPRSGGIRFTIGLQVDSSEEVDPLTQQMRRAGASVTKEPVDAQFFTGRSAYLFDPEATTSRSSGPTCQTTPSSSPPAGRQA